MIYLLIIINIQPISKIIPMVKNMLYKRVNFQETEGVNLKDFVLQ